MLNKEITMLPNKFFSLTMLLLLAACSTTQPEERSQLDLAGLQALLPGNYVGMGSRGEVFHSIIQLQVPKFGGNVFYHHISTESLRGPAWQRKVYLFDDAGQQMQATVLLGTSDGLADNQSIVKTLSALTEEQLLRFPDGCQIQWSTATDMFVANVSRDNCTYDSPAFGGLVSPEMQYQLTRFGLVISEGIYRQDGSPVSPVSSIDAKRLNSEAEDC